MAVTETFFHVDPSVAEAEAVSATCVPAALRSRSLICTDLPVELLLPALTHASAVYLAPRGMGPVEDDSWSV